MPPYIAKLHLPSTHPEGSNETVPCNVDFCDGRELRISTPEPLARGAAVSVEHEDALLLGEVLWSAGQSGVWQHSIKVEQILNGLMTIMALRAHLLQETRTLFHVAKPLAASRRQSAARTYVGTVEDFTDLKCPPDQLGPEADSRISTCRNTAQSPQRQGFSRESGGYGGCRES